MASKWNGERTFPLEVLYQFGTNNQHLEAMETIWWLLCTYPEILLRFRLKMPIGLSKSCGLGAEVIITQPPGHFKNHTLATFVTKITVSQNNM